MTSPRRSNVVQNDIKIYSTCAESSLYNHSRKMASLETAKMFSLEGQTALVTGGTRGIGQAAAIALAEAGADIILIQVNFTTPCCISQCNTYLGPLSLLTVIVNSETVPKPRR